MRKKLRILEAMFICLAIFFSFSDISYAAGEGPEWTFVENNGADYLNTEFVDRDYSVATAVCGDFLYTAWIEGLGVDSELHVKKYDGNSWIPVGNTAGSSRLDEDLGAVGDPAIAELNGNIYVAWKEVRNDSSKILIRVKKYDGSSWQYVETYNEAYQDTWKDGESINYRSGMEAKEIKLMADNGVLYAAWAEYMTSAYQVRVAQYDDAANEWTTIDGVGEQIPGLNYAPGENSQNLSLAMYKGKLYVAWEEGNCIRVKRYDGNRNWTFIDGGGDSGLCYDDESSLRETPVLAEYDGYLYMVWVESTIFDEDMWAWIPQIRLMRYNDASAGSWEIIDQSSDAGFNYSPQEGAAYTPAMMVHNGKLFLSWSEYAILDEDYNSFSQIRVMSYDGTNKTFIDGNLFTGINKDIWHDAQNPVIAIFKNQLILFWQEASRYEDYNPHDWQVRAKQLPFPFATVTAGQPLTEADLDGKSIDITLSWLNFMDGALDKNNFILNDGPPGLTVGAVQYLSSTACRVNLAFNGTDFDRDINLGITIAPVELSLDTPLTSDNISLTSINTLAITANNDEESISITDNGDIWEKQENGKAITVTLNGGTFAPVINAANWTVSNLPAGVSKGNVARVDARTVRITLSGNATADYTGDITNVTVSCTAGEYFDSTGGGNLSANTGVTLKQRTYPVTYHANGGTGTAPTETNKAANATFAAANNSFTPPSGRQFKHWNTSADGTGTSYAAGALVTMPAGALNLYAIWEDIPVVWQGDGLSELTAYRVESAAHLNAIRTKGMSAYYYIQTADINLTGDWEPIGTYAVPFTGHYDGGGHTVSNLTINKSGSDGIGLIGFISGGGSIKDLHITGADVKGNINIGILAGIIANGGGIQGGGTIENCSAAGTVIGTARVGGVIGSIQHNNAVVEKSYSTATVSANAGNTAQKGAAGGFAGFILQGTAQDCYSAGSVTAGNHTGGFAGVMEGGTVQRCYSVADEVSGTQPRGFLSSKTGGSVSNDSFYNSDTGLSDSYGTPKVTGQLMELETFATWDFNGTWHIWEDHTYPALQWQLPAVVYHANNGTDEAPVRAKKMPDEPFDAADNTFTPPTGKQFKEWNTSPDGSGTTSYAEGAEITMPAGGLILYAIWEDIPVVWQGNGLSKETAYQVESAAHLNDVRNKTGVGVYFEQTADIDLSGVEWTPIGAFNGQYNGKGYTVQGLAISKPGNDNVGLFGMIDGGTVDNLHIAGANVTGNDKVGILAGRIQGGGKVTNSSAAGNATGREMVGGLTGYVVENSNSMILYSFATGIVTASGNYAGGLVGNNRGKIEECFSNGTVNANNGLYIGGLAGDNWNGHIKNCYATGDVTGKNNVGGLVGWHGYGGYTIENSFSAGKVSGSSPVGGLVGVNSSGTVSNSFYDMQKSGQNDNVLKGSPKETDDMKKQETFAVWDFNDTWHIWEDHTYPALQWQLPAVVYHANNGTDEAPVQAKKMPDELFYAADNTFTPPSGKQFREWNTSPDGSGTTSYAEGAEITMPAGGLILYAIWEDAPPVGTIEGTVRDSSGAPVLGVHVRVTVSGTEYSAITDTNGSYSITGVPAGEGYTVTAGKPGYTGASKTGVNVTADTTTSCEDIILAYDPEVCPVIYQGAQKIWNEGSNTYDIRFFAVTDTLDAGEVGFVFSKTHVKPTRANASVIATPTVYTSITAPDLTVTAESLGGRYIFACTVTGIPAAQMNIPLYVRAFSTVGAETKYTEAAIVIAASLP